MKIKFLCASPSGRGCQRHSLDWHGTEPLRGVSNYFLGSDPRRWHTRVAHYAQLEAADALEGASIVVYGGEEGVEYDLRIPPEADTKNLCLQISGAVGLRLDPQGDLYMRAGGREIRMRKPTIYQDRGGREPVEGGYVLRPDGTVGFHVGRHDPGSTLVLDPSLSLSYASFLGGAGDDAANGIALDSTGKIYIGGTTTSATTFPEAGSTQQGPGGATEFFIAKIDPSASGPNSLIYLTFVGGSGSQAGGNMAVDASGNAAIMGVTTSLNYPVTDGSQRTTGTNDLAVTEIDPTGSKLVYSTLFGGSGAESTQSAGGIAFGLLDKVEYIYVVADTNSTDLPATDTPPAPVAYQTAYGGGTTDGFLAIFQPATTPHLFYCTYLGINAQVGVSGVAVDAGGNAYVAGFTSNPGTSFTALNGFQTVYGGDPFDAFLMEFHEYGQGSADLAYGTFLGGSASDQAFAVAVGVPMPATAYVTGTTSSTNFPGSMSSTINATTVGPQTTLKGTANVFFTAVGQVIGQDGTLRATSLLYSTYLGGSQTDAGLAVAITAANSAYVAGRTNSWDFPWQDNFQPFNGDSDAFVAKLDLTQAAAASLLYATPLGGTAPPGFAAVSDGNAIASNGSGNVYLAGNTTTSDFPRAGNPDNGFQVTCSSCQSSPQAGDAFLVAFAENAAAAPSLSFNALSMNFGQQPVGSKTVPNLVAGMVNTGDAPLNVTSLGITGPNSPDFALVGSEPCLTAPIPPGVTCSFEVGFSPSTVGPEQAFIVIGDDAPGSPQALALLGIGNGPLAVLTPSSMNFGDQPENTTGNQQILTITNEGNQVLTISKIGLGGVDAPDFQFVLTNCASVASVPPGGVCQVGISFDPPSVGSFNAEIDVGDNSGGAPGVIQSVQLTGTGTAPAPIASVLPLSLTFGSQAVGTASAVQIVSLSNTGSTALTISTIAFSGGDAGNFGVTPSGSSPCPLSGGTIAINAGCTVAVDFAPIATGAKSATLNFNDNAGNNPQAVTLTGNGIAPAAKLSPLNLDFGTQSVGVQSAAQPVTLASKGTAPLALNGISITGPNAGDFMETDTCPPSLGANATCVINVTLTPTAAGNRTASLSVADNAPGSPQVVSLAGTAAQAGISLSPTTISFGSQLVGASSQPAGLKVSNTGSGKLVLNKISFSGGNAGDFTETDNCSAGISPAGSCTIQVTFTPLCAAIPDARSATLTLADNAPGSPQTIPLSGTAAGSVCLDPPPGGLSQSISPGQTATFPLTLISMGGYAGQAALTCAGAPAGYSCSLPSPITVTAGSVSAIQVVVGPTALSATLEVGRRVSGTNRGNHWSLPALGLLIIAWWALVGRISMRRTDQRARECVQAVGLSIILALGTACVGAGGGTNTVPSTPQGTSVLPISATAGGTTTTLTLALTIN